MSFKPCSLGSPGAMDPLPHRCPPLTCITDWVFTGNLVLLFKKQNITTLLNARVLRTEWKPLSGASRPLGSAPCPASSSLQLHFSLSRLPLCVLEASYFLQFSEHLFTAPNPHFLPSLVLNTSSSFGSQPRCHLLQEAFSGFPSLGYILAPSTSSLRGSLPFTPPPPAATPPPPWEVPPGQRGLTLLWEPSYTVQAGEGAEN